VIFQTTVKEPLLDWLDRFLTVEKQVNLLDRPFFLAAGNTSGYCLPADGLG
jgi:hypothetical protein